MSDTTVQFYAKDGREALVSSVRAATGGNHCHIGIWNRGGLAGTICVNAVDAEKIIDRLLPPAQRAPEHTKATI